MEIFITGTWIDMNDPQLSVLSISVRLMYFKIKSQNLADEGTLNYCY